MDTIFGYPVTFNVDVDGKYGDLTSTLKVRVSHGSGSEYEPAMFAVSPDDVLRVIEAHRRTGACCCNCRCR